MFIVFNRLPKFKSEVKKVLREPLPSFIIDRFPALQESTMAGASSFYQGGRGTPHSSRKNTLAESEKDLSPTSLKRTRSEPPIHTKGGIKKLHRDKSIGRQTSVKFSSCDDPDEFAITSVELEGNTERFKRDPSVKLRNGANLHKIQETSQEVVKIYLNIIYTFIFRFMFGFIY